MTTAHASAVGMGAATDAPPFPPPGKTRKPRAKSEHPPVMRTDLLASNLTAAKEARIEALFQAWTRGVLALGTEQWRLFFQTGKLDKNHDRDKVTFKALMGNAARVQMGRYAVVGQLQSWLSNRANDFRAVVSSYDGQASLPGGMLDPGVRHMLHAINVRKAWFSREPIVMPRTATGVLGGTAEDILEDVMEDVVEDIWEDVLDTNGAVMGRRLVGTRVVGQRVVGQRVVGTHTVGGTPLAGLTIPDDVRKLARSIMRAVMAKHRRPNLAHLPMVLDARGGTLLPPKRATQNGRVGYWVRLSTMEPGHTIDVPLLAHPFHQARAGTRVKGISIQRARDAHPAQKGETGRKRTKKHEGESGRKHKRAFRFAVVTDTGAACAASRAAYADEAAALKASGHHPGAPLDLYHESTALDFGLGTLFGTSEGQLLGLEWGKRLRAYDARIQNIAKGVQRRGGKLRDNARYQAAVQDLQGWITTEVNRVLHRLVARRKPTELVVERLDFRSPTLSRRMNRLVSTCGRKAIAAKLQDLKDRFGIAATEVNPAYTSQTCSRPGCGYVDKRNRPTQGTFRCRWCGHTMHADLNAAANISQRRALPGGGLYTSKAATLAGCVRAFGERKVGAVRGPNRPGDKGVPDDPRVTNPYFAAEMAKARASAQASTIHHHGEDGEAIAGSEIDRTRTGIAQVV